jgi:putative membrane protein
VVAAGSRAAAAVLAAADRQGVGDMSGLSPDERDAIQTAIESAEKRTSAEFVTVIAKSVESYLYIPTLVAAVVTLIISGVLLLFREILPFSATELYAGQVVLFAVLALSFRIPEIRFALVPKSVRLARASNHARKMFLDLGMTETEDRNAVLLFIALGERYVEIIADVGLQQKLESSQAWDAVVEKFIGDIQAGDIAEGYTHAIEGCADVMAVHFPNRDDAPNRFPDRLIEI